MEKIAQADGEKWPRDEADAGREIVEREREGSREKGTIDCFLFREWTMWWWSCEEFALQFYVWAKVQVIG